MGGSWEPYRGVMGTSGIMKLHGGFMGTLWGCHGGLMRVHGGAMILHGGLMGASWGPHEGLMKSDKRFMGAL